MSERGEREKNVFRLYIQFMFVILLLHTVALCVIYTVAPGSLDSAENEYSTKKWVPNSLAALYISLHITDNRKAFETNSYYEWKNNKEEISNVWNEIWSMIFPISLILIVFVFNE